MSDGTMSAVATARYPFLIDIVTKRYFDGVDNKRLDQVLACFHDEAVLTEETSGTVHSGRDRGIASMFRRLFADHSQLWHGNFVHTGDVEANAICSQFTVLITPEGGAQLRYENCNRFYLDGDKFSGVHVYMSGEGLLKEGRD